MRLLLLIGGVWFTGSLLLGLALGRIFRRLGRRYPAAGDAASRNADRDPGP